MTNDMLNLFCLSTAVLDGRRVIQFANRSDEFIEVIFTIDGREVKDGNPFTSDIRGYGYPPKLERPVKKMRGGSCLQFRRDGGEVKAYIFSGRGAYHDVDLNIPAFMRKRLAVRMKFQRNGNQPTAILRCSY